jgi:hypothetical protein
LLIQILKTNFIFLLERRRIGAIFQSKRILHRVLGLPSRALDGSPNEILGSEFAHGGTAGTTPERQASQQPQSRAMMLGDAKDSCRGETGRLEGGKVF